MTYLKGHIPWNKNVKGIHLSPQSEFKKGSSGFTGKHSEESKRRMSESRKGIPNWNSKIEKIDQICIQCKKPFKIWPARIRQEKGKLCSKDCKYKFLNGRIPWNKGIESKIKGDKHYNWQGGKTAKQYQIIHSFKYRQFRIKVFERDDYTCQICGYDKGGYLEVDHILPQSLFP